MSTHPVAVKRRHDRRRNSRILIGLLVLVLLAFGLFAINDLRSGVNVTTDSAAAQTAPEITFTSPDKKVICQLTEQVARCTTPQPEFTAPVQCPGAPEIRVSAEEAMGAFVCNDSPIEAKQVLVYGDRVSRGDLTCHSYTAALRCVHTVTQHGFSLSNKSYIVF